ncbi:MAG: pectin acetylesterase-family hydrolase, partial [Bdellovibrionota bacterium]
MVVWTALTLWIATTQASLAAPPADQKPRRWKQIEVPGAVCGDGTPYHVLVEKRNPTKWAITLNQGGACWNLATCVGPTPLTWIHPWPEVTNLGGLTSTRPEKSPLHDYSMIFFPYCTGDVHVGDHVANYNGVTIHHRGRRNVEDGIRLLEEMEIMRFSKIKEILLYWPSAGALGILHHATWIEK